MKLKLTLTGAALALAIAAYADYTPIPLTPGSFTADVVIENTAPVPMNSFATATMDGGTNISSRTFFEQGFSTNAPTAGLPPAGTIFTAQADTGGIRQFQMPPSYSAPNALFINSQVTTGRLTLTTPTVLQAFSVLGSSGGSAIVLDCKITYSDDSSETIQITCPDWFNGASYAWIANGRYNLDNLQFDNVYNNNPRLYYIDGGVGNTTLAVKSFDFTWVSGTGRSCLMGISGLAPGGSTYTPLAITGFTKDMVIEAAAPHRYGSLYTATTATMDGGTNNQSNTWYERGLNTGTPTSGLPTAGTTFTAVGAANHSFTMPASYVGDNALFIASSVTSGTLTLNTPTALTGLSFLSSCGGGAIPLNYTVHFQDGSSEQGSFTSLDWFNTTDATTGWTSNGRFNVENCGFNEVNANPQRPRLHFNDIVLANTTSPVTSIDFSYGGSGGRLSLFAVSGQASAGGNFTPLAVTGFNRDVVVENVSPVTRYTQPARLDGYSNVSMDGGTNNTGNTWYEQGFYPTFPTSGLPPAGSTITSLDLPDHHYQMPASYSANNAIYVDQAHPLANVTPVTPAWYSALSFLSATANNNVTNQCIMQYSDGTSETNTFTSRDWFNNTPYAFTARGRVNLNNQTINADPARQGTGAPNPRLYEAQFALSAPPGVMLTNIVLTFVGAVNPTTGRMVALAVSGTTGEVAPIILNQPPVTILTMEGSNVVVAVTTGGGTPPITYQWQVDKGSGFVNVANGDNISGANAAALTFTSIGWTNAGAYRFVATGPSLSTTSSVCTVTVLSGLPDVTQPTDPVLVYQPNGGGVPPDAENVDKAIDNTTSKYLNRGSGTTPFSGPGGLTVTPMVGGTIVSAIRFYTANDAEARDPADFTLEGSRDGGANYTTIATSALAMPAGRNAAGLTLNPFTLPMVERQLGNAASYTSYRLSINSVKGSDALMQFGEVELLGVVDPHSVPTVLVPPASTSVNEGGTATFSVSAFGPGTLGYQWRNVTAGEPGIPVGGNSPSLVLANVTAAMNGNLYRVVVTNEYGAVTSTAVPLPGAQLTVVSGPPIITTDLAAAQLVYAGRTSVLPVTISGNEPFTLQWTKDSVNVTDSARIIGSQSNILVITDAQLADSGTYKLSITNGQGFAESAFQALTVQKIPAFTADGLGWALNGVQGANNTAFPATMNIGVLGLTEGFGSTARSAWYRTPLYIGAFKAAFTYQDVNGGGADGMAFALQNDSRGIAALGGQGGSLGYSGITPSVAVEFNIFGTAGIAFNTNGNTGGYSATTPVNVASGDPIRTEISYAAGVAHLVLSNTVTAATFTADLPVGNFVAALGKDTAYVGFTGADGGTPSTQNVWDFQFIPQPTLTAKTVGGAVVLSWPASIGGYTIQSSSSLTSGWTDAGLTATIVGNQYQATVSAPSGDKFYRLVITP